MEPRGQICFKYDSSLYTGGFTSSIIRAFQDMPRCVAAMNPGIPSHQQSPRACPTPVYTTRLLPLAERKIAHLTPSTPCNGRTPQRLSRAAQPLTGLATPSFEQAAGVGSEGGNPASLDLSLAVDEEARIIGGERSIGLMVRLVDRGFQQFRANSAGQTMSVLTECLPLMVIRKTSVHHEELCVQEMYVGITEAGFAEQSSRQKF